MGTIFPPDHLVLTHVNEVAPSPENAMRRSPKVVLTFLMRDRPEPGAHRTARSLFAPMDAMFVVDMQIGSRSVSVITPSADSSGRPFATNGSARRLPGRRGRRPERYHA